MNKVTIISRKPGNGGEAYARKSAMRMLTEMSDPLIDDERLILIVVDCDNIYTKAMSDEILSSMKSEASTASIVTMDSYTLSSEDEIIEVLKRVVSFYDMTDDDKCVIYINHIVQNLCGNALFKLAESINENCAVVAYNQLPAAGINRY